MSLYKHIIFDLDGCLSDSLPGILKGIEYALSKYGIHPQTPGEFKRLIGRPLHESLQEHYIPEEEEVWKAVGYFREYYAEKGLFEASLYPGIYELLKELVAADRKLFIATAKPTVYAERMLAHFEVADGFAKILGCHLNGNRSDKKEMIREIHSLWPMSKGKTLFVGDRKYDIMAAQACEVDSVGVTYGYGSKGELENAGPTYLVHSVPELRQILLS